MTDDLVKRLREPARLLMYAGNEAEALAMAALEAADALERLSQQAEPVAGYVIVPQEPTQAMLYAAQSAWTPGVSYGEANAIRYKAMLAAAPPAVQQAEPVAYLDPITGFMRRVKDIPPSDMEEPAFKLLFATGKLLWLYAAPPADDAAVVVTWDEARTRIVAVTRQDCDGRIVKVIAEAPPAVQQAEPKKLIRTAPPFDVYEGDVVGALAHDSLSQQQAEPVCEHKNQLWSINMKHGHCADCKAQLGEPRATPQAEPVAIYDGNGFITPHGDPVPIGPLYAAPPAVQQAEPVAWSDLIEQRLLTWRQRFVNRSGDQLALDDFMDKQSLDDLIDFVCAAAPADDEAVRLLREARGWLAACDLKDAIDAYLAKRNAPVR